MGGGTWALGSRSMSSGSETPLKYFGIPSSSDSEPYIKISMGSWTSTIALVLDIALVLELPEDELLEDLSRGCSGFSGTIALVLEL